MIVDAKEGADLFSLLPSTLDDLKEIVESRLKSISIMLQLLPEVVRVYGPNKICLVPCLIPFSRHILSQITLQPLRRRTLLLQDAIISGSGSAKELSSLRDEIRADAHALMIHGLHKLALDVAEQFKGIHSKH